MYEFDYIFYSLNTSLVYSDKTVCQQSVQISFHMKNPFQKFLFANIVLLVYQPTMKLSDLFKVNKLTRLVYILIAIYFTYSEIHSVCMLSCTSKGWPLWSFLMYVIKNVWMSLFPSHGSSTRSGKCLSWKRKSGNIQSSIPLSPSALVTTGINDIHDK